MQPKLPSVAPRNVCIRGTAGNGLGGDEYTGASPTRYAKVEGVRE